MTPFQRSPLSQAGIRLRPVHSCCQTQMSGLASLVYDEHMDGGWKRLALEMPCLKNEIQARGLNVIISPTHHRPVAASTGHKEWQDKALLQQSREDGIHRVLSASRQSVIPWFSLWSVDYKARNCSLRSCSRTVISSQ